MNSSIVSPPSRMTRPNGTGESLHRRRGVREGAVHERDLTGRFRQPVDERLRVQRARAVQHRDPQCGTGYLRLVILEIAEDRGGGRTLRRCRELVDVGLAVDGAPGHRDVDRAGEIEMHSDGGVVIESRPPEPRGGRDDDVGRRERGIAAFVTSGALEIDRVPQAFDAGGRETQSVAARAKTLSAVAVLGTDQIGARIVGSRGDPMDAFVEACLDVHSLHRFVDVHDVFVRAHAASREGANENRSRKNCYN